MKYDFELNVQLENNSHTQLISRVPDGSLVLEIGCATGYMSQYLTEHKKCTVIGVEMDAMAAKQAENFCEKVICTNVENEKWFSRLSEQQFDVVLCADILEHLRDPICFLQKIKPFIKADNGVLIASVPNGAHVSLRLELLAGHFTYEDTGLLDKTHLHLFTHSSIRALFNRASYQVAELSYTFHDIPNPVIDERLKRLGLKANNEFYSQMHQPEAAAYQYIILANPHKAVETASIGKELTDKPMRESWDFYYNFRDAYNELDDIKNELQQENEQLRLIYNGLPFRLSRKIKQVLKIPKKIIKKLKKAPLPMTINQTPAANYQDWIKEKEPLSLSEQRKMKEYLSNLNDKPLISIVMPVYNAQPDYLLESVHSILQQSYQKWQLCIVDDGSNHAQIHQILTELQDQDKRIQVIFREQNGGIIQAINSAFELAQGEFIGLINQHDKLALDALYYFAKNISENPDIRLIYSDEDKINAQGERFNHYFKPDYNADLMLADNIMAHFAVYQSTLIKKLGGLREEYQGAHDYDLALRFIQQINASQICHIPHILYHWREAKAYQFKAAKKAVKSHLQALGYNKKQVTVSQSPLIEGHLRIQYALPSPPPLVSIIIPTKNGVELLKQCIQSIQKYTAYSHYEIIVVDNQSDEQQSLDYMQDLANQGVITLIQYQSPFNYSAINNVAVKQAKGELIALLNNDIEAIEEGWLNEMVSQALRPNIGAVGARLWYPNQTLQHGGVVLGLGGVAGHAMKHMAKNRTGYNARAVLVQNYSAVTAACLVMRKNIFEQVKGFNEIDLKVAFNDVDLCLRIGELNLNIVWTPHANLLHHESASRGDEDTPEKQRRFESEIDYMMSRWGAKLAHDPAYNQNLTHGREDFSLNW